jgi:hypothetical protein
MGSSSRRDRGRVRRSAVPEGVEQPPVCVAAGLLAARPCTVAGDTASLGIGGISRIPGASHVSARSSPRP